MNMNETLGARPWRVPALLVAALCSGCMGAAGQVSVQTGGAADKGGLASGLDAPLAVGGEVRPALHVDVPGLAGPPTHFISARPDVIGVRDGLLVGRAPGMSAVLVAVGGDTVVDLLHVWVKPADRLEVHGIDAGGGDVGPLSEPIELLVNDSTRLVPHPYSGADRLIGVGTSTWVVEPPIAIVLREGLPNRVRLVARTPGEAHVKVTMLGATSLLTLKVVL
jgi:hypothetical protein